MLGPIRLCPPSFQSLLQVPVDPLHHAVTLGVVGRGGDVLDPQLLTGGGPDRRGELASPSEVMMAGMPNLAIQLLMRASTQVSVSMEAKGIASSHLLDRSMMVNRYRKPSLETVRGPTKSTWM